MSLSRVVSRFGRGLEAPSQDDQSWILLEWLVLGSPYLWLDRIRSHTGRCVDLGYPAMRGLELKGVVRSPGNSLEVLRAVFSETA